MSNVPVTSIATSTNGHEQMQRRKASRPSTSARWSNDTHMTTVSSEMVLLPCEQVRHITPTLTNVQGKREFNNKLADTTSSYGPARGASSRSRPTLDWLK